MIKHVTGNILDSSADALVNTVNAVGVMGKGIALHFRQAFPDNYDAYVRACEHREVQPGHMFVFHRLTHPRWIINFPTKRVWRRRARMADIESGLKALIETVKHEEIKSIAVPPLGCGNGGLDWNQVRSRIESAFTSLTDVAVFLYEPKGAPAADEMTIATSRPRMTAGRAALISLIDHHVLPWYRVTLLEIQKLATSFRRFSALIEGFETPHSMELLATVHWLANEDPAAKTDPNDAVAGVQAWNEHKKLAFSAEHVRTAWQWLKEKGWI